MLRPQRVTARFQQTLSREDLVMTKLGKGIIIAVIAVVLLVVIVIGVLLGAGVYGWKAAQREGNEAATQQDLKTIAAVEIQYYNTHNRTFGTLDQLIKEGMLSSKFSGNPATADGYIFTLSVRPRTVNQPSSYALNADPQSDTTGKNHFYIDSNSPAIHVNPDRPAGANDPVRDK
jgi:Tfp pilus assembly protein PilE